MYDVTDIYIYIYTLPPTYPSTPFQKWRPRTRTYPHTQVSWQLSSNLLRFIATQQLQSPDQLGLKPVIDHDLQMHDSQDHELKLSIP